MNEQAIDRTIRGCTTDIANRYSGGALKEGGRVGCYLPLPSGHATKPEGMGQRRVVLSGVWRKGGSGQIIRDVEWSCEHSRLTPLFGSFVRGQFENWHTRAGVHLQGRVRTVSIQGCEVYAEIVSTDALDEERMEVGAEGHEASIVQSQPDVKVPPSHSGSSGRRKRLRSSDEAWSPKHDLSDGGW